MKDFLRLLKKRRGVLFSTLAILLICGVVTVTASNRGIALFTGAQITNWGLSFQEEGKPPVGNASSEYLAQYDALYCRDTGEKKMYLTFDAGFENGNTEPILDALKKHNVKAVFFLVGNYLETQPELVKRMVAEGHTVGNHTYSHPDMSAILDEASFQNELLKNAELYREVTGQEMSKLYRPPQGKFCETNLKMAQKLGYHTVFWSLAYVDWYENNQPTESEAYEKLLPRAHPGAVILLHSTSKTNGEILDELLVAWKNQGYTFGDLSAELLGASSQNGPSAFEWQEIHS